MFLSRKKGDFDRSGGSMRHLKLVRALVGSAGLIGCVGLLASQARADIVEFYPAPAIADDTGDAPSAGIASEAFDPIERTSTTPSRSTADDAPRPLGSQGLIRRFRELLDKPKVGRPAD